MNPSIKLIQSRISVLLCALLLLCGCSDQPAPVVDCMYEFPSLEEVASFVLEDVRTEPLRAEDGSFWLYLPEPPEGFSFSRMWSTSYSQDYHFVYLDEAGARYQCSWGFGRNGPLYFENYANDDRYTLLEENLLMQGLITEYGEEVEIIMVEKGQFFHLFMPKTVWEQNPVRPSVRSERIQ